MNYFGTLIVLVAILQTLAPLRAKAQDTSIVPNQKSISKTLSLRLKPRQITYERPITGYPLKINNGATVLLQHGAVQGVINSEPIRTSIKLIPNEPIIAHVEMKQKPIQPIEMKVLGSSIYLDRLVELLIVQDITGRNIKTLIKGNKMNLDDLKSGVYIVRVQDKGLTHTSKFILR